MKQISKVEYDNYVIQQNDNVEMLDPSGKPIDTPANTLTDSKTSNERELSLNDDESLIKSFYSFASSTQQPALSSQLNTNSRNQKIVENAGNEEFLLNDISGGEDLLDLDNASKSESSEAEFDLFETSVKKQKRTLSNGVDDSVHYITLSASPSFVEKLVYNKEKNVYVNTLTIKQAQVKDAGIYVCFGANSKGYNYRKAHLKVIPSPNAAPETTLPANFNNLDLAKLKELNEMLNQNNKQTTHKIPILINTNSNSKNSATGNGGATSFTSLTSSIQSIGFLIILVPVALITLFALISVCYLKRMDTSTRTNISLCDFLASCLCGCCKKQNEDDDSSSKGTYDESYTSSCCCCLPKKRLIKHHPIKNSFDDDLVNRLNYKRRELTKSTLASQTSATNTTCCGNNTNNNCGTTIGSLGAKSDSTQGTTVAYYLTVPVGTIHPSNLINGQFMTINNQNNNNMINSSILSSSTMSSDSSNPPPLPASQPPTFSPIKNEVSISMAINDDMDANENNYMLHSNQQQQHQANACNLNRAESTASMTYYKIVEGDYNTISTNNNNPNRFYYQLATVPQVLIQNANGLSTLQQVGCNYQPKTIIASNISSKF
jgi:hypothetical protein